MTSLSRAKPLQFPTFLPQRRDSSQPMALGSLWGPGKDPAWHPLQDELSVDHEKPDAQVCLGAWWRKVPFWSSMRS